MVITYYYLFLVFHCFEYGQYTVLITTTGEIKADYVGVFFDNILKKQPEEIEKVLPKKCQLTVFSGYHCRLDPKDEYYSAMTGSAENFSSNV